MSAPDLAEHVVGFRQWRPGAGGELLPVSGGTAAWDGPREVRARCSVWDSSALLWPGPCPHPDPCDCGFNAYHEVVWSSSPSAVAGAVACRGDVYVHELGFRAEYARPLALCWADWELPGVSTGLTARLEVRRDFVESFARRAGLPALPATALLDYALEFGSPVPVALRPKALAA